MLTNFASKDSIRLIPLEYTSDAYAGDTKVSAAILIDSNEATISWVSHHLM